MAFSWENKPGECKAAVAPPFYRLGDDDLGQKQLRAPPCTSARKGQKKVQKDGVFEDPFLAAFRECTNGEYEKSCKLKQNKTGFGGWMNLFGHLSCKHLTAVRDDSLISSPVSKRTV